VALGLALVWAGTGCGTFSYYPEGMEHTTLAPLRTGQRTGYERTFAKRTEGRDGMLFAMEMGRVAQLEGDLDTSRAAFEKAIAAWETRDDQAVVSASGAGAQAGAVLVNDKAIPYRAPEYERALVHHYQTLNYLATNDLIGAGGGCGPRIGGRRRRAKRATGRATGRPPATPACRRGRRAIRACCRSMRASTRSPGA
jgi:hypothetical protein